MIMSLNTKHIHTWQNSRGDYNLCERFLYENWQINLKFRKIDSKKKKKNIYILFTIDKNIITLTDVREKRKEKMHNLEYLKR